MVNADSRGEQIRNQQVRRDVATIRGDLNRLGRVLGAQDLTHAATMLRNLIAAVTALETTVTNLGTAVTDLQTRVAALEAKAPPA